MLVIWLRIWFACMVLLALPGCVFRADWSQCIWHKTADSQIVIEEARTYMRSVPVYDHFSTRAIFDVLILSDEVRSLYAQAHALRRSRSVKQSQCFLQRQLNKNKESLSFYVVSLRGIALADEYSDWHIVLKYGTETYKPREIKMVDMPLEYKHFFGSRYARFKGVFEVTFDTLKELQASSNGDAQMLTMKLYCVDKDALVSWDLSTMSLSGEGV